MDIVRGCVSEVEFEVDLEPEVCRICRLALEYGALGLRVMPVCGMSKRPSMKCWPTHATCDPGVIRSLFEQHPDINLGIATGQGIVALDFDKWIRGDDDNWIHGSPFESLKKLKGGRQFPPTATAITGGGGRHLLFRVPDGVRIRNAQRRLLPGLDVRGDGGFIVVEPSIHPRTRKEYTWERHPSQGIADAPKRVIALLEDAGLWHRIPGGSESAERTSGRSGPTPVLDGRYGDEDELLADVTRRFPVGGYGERNDLMVQVVASLLGRGYGPDVTYAVTREWWQFFYAKNVIRTHPKRAPGMIRATIRVLQSSTTFVPARSDVDHDPDCRSIELEDWQLERMQSVITALSQTQLGARNTPILRASQAIQRRLCETDQEQAFVEALIVLVTHKRRLGESPISMTNAQVQALVTERHPDTPLEHRQTFERLKERYITRQNGEKPASRFELLREIRKGTRKPGQAVGIPSEYEATGIERLLAPPVGHAAGLPVSSVA
jgi:hypothetical protein